MYKLRLDHDGVYWGADRVGATDDAADVKAGDVVLDHEPDNAPGRYRWDAAVNALIALPPSQVKTVESAPSVEQALHALLEHLEAAGHALPSRVSAWVAAFKRSMDADGGDQ